MTPKNPVTDILKTRDAVLTNLLYYIAQSEQLNSELILHGGGALHFVYSSPRYSSDIDFVCPNIRIKKDEIITGLTDGFKSRISKISHNKTMEQHTPKLVRNLDDYIRVSYSQNRDNTPSARIEIVEQTAQDYAPAIGKFHPVLVESPGEIYADKIVATLGRMIKRGSLKGTDLFDLDYIANNLGGVPSEETILKKRDSYDGEGWSRNNFERVLKYISDQNNHNQIIDSIKATLMPDVYQAMKEKFGKEFFEKTASHFETLRLVE
jgi:hypothetical protein